MGLDNLCPFDLHVRVFHSTLSAMSALLSVPRFIVCIRNTAIGHMEEKNVLHSLTFSKTEGTADDCFRWISNSASQFQNVILILFQVPHPEQTKGCNSLSIQLS